MRDHGGSAGWTTVQKAIVWLVAAATCLMVGLALAASASDPAREQSDGWNMVGALVWVAAIPCAIVGVFYLIRAAARP